MGTGRVATLLLLAAALLAASGTVLAVVSLQEVDRPGLVTALSAVLVSVGTAVFLVGLVLKVRTDRTTD